MITTQHIPTHVACEPVQGRDTSMQVLYHPSVGRLELGMSSYFQWGAMPLVRSALPGYETSAGLYATWQREDHALELMILQAINDQDAPQPPASHGLGQAPTSSME